MNGYPNFPDDADIIGENGDAFIPKGKNGQAIGPRYFAAKCIKKDGLIFFEKKGFFAWADGGWVPVSDYILQSKISDLILNEVRAYSSSQKSLFQTIRPKGPSIPAYDLANTKNIIEIQKTMKYMCYHGERLPPLDPNVIPVRNGVLRWNAEKEDFDKLKAYTPDDMIFHTLDVDYDSNANPDFFNEKLAEILPKEDDRRVVQEFFGASLFSENRTKKFIVFSGVSNSGKSTLAGLFTEIITPKRIFDIDSQGHSGSFPLAGLTNQTVITIFEAGEDLFCKSFFIELIKKTSGNDRFKSNRKNSNEQIEHIGRYSIIITSNYNQKFKIEGDGAEYANRLIPIIFEKPIENPDLTLANKLLSSHRSAFFNWMLDGARSVRRNNWLISLSPAQTLRRDRIIQATRGVDLFVKNYVRWAPGRFFTTHDAFSAYIYLHRVAGFERLDEGIFQKRFADTMSDVFGKVYDKNLPDANGKRNARGYKNVALVKNTIEQNKNQNETVPDAWGVRY